MRKIMVLVVSLLCMAFVDAEYQQLNTEVHYSVDNSTFRIWGENFDRSYNININNNYFSPISDTQNVVFYRNITSQSEQDYSTLAAQINYLTTCTQNLSSSMGDFVGNKFGYYDKYTACYSDLTICNDYKAQDYRGRLDNCTNALAYMDKDSTNTKTLYGNLVNDNNRLKLDYDATIQQRNFLGVACIICLGAAVYLFMKYVRKRDVSRENILERGDSRSIQGLK